jgi:hypothetical protein
LEQTLGAPGCSHGLQELAMVREGPAQPAPYPAEKARRGKIILRKPWQRAVFIFGLALPVFVLFVLR